LRSLVSNAHGLKPVEGWSDERGALPRGEESIPKWARPKLKEKETAPQRGIRGPTTIGTASAGREQVKLQ